MEKVGVVILNYKLKSSVLACVESVRKSKYKNIDIVVVDNNSGDALEEDLPSLDNIYFVQTGANLGYTGGNNAGIKKALDREADFVFVLNPDTEVLPDTIGTLVAGADKYSADIVGPKIYFMKTKTIWFAGGKIDLDNVLGSHRGVDEADKGQFNEDCETDYITGAAMLVRSEVYKKIGYFDERYYLYYEDSDFCMRAKKAGFKIYYIHEAVVMHENAKSTGLGSPLQDYFTTRNRLLFAFKYLPWRTRLALLREVVRNSRYPTRRLALGDFMRGKFGKGSFIK